MKLLEWIGARVGHAIDVDGAYGPQCVDAVNDYLAQVYPGGRVSGNAIDIAGQKVPGFHWAENTPTNVAPAGAVVVWGRRPVLGIGEFGHCAVCVVADEDIIISADQNWGGRAYVTLEAHSYVGVLGWQMPVR